MIEEQVTKREAIMEAAVNVFAEMGFHNAKVETIAKAANVGKGTIYEYFSSKKDLFVEMVEYFSLKFIDMAEVKLFDKDSAIEKLDTFIDLQIDIAYKFAPLVRISHQCSFWADRDFYHTFIKLRNRKIKVISSIFEKGIETGEFVNCNINMAVNILVGGLMIITTPLVMYNESIGDRDQLKEEIIDIILNGIANKAIR